MNKIYAFLTIFIFFLTIFLFLFNGRVYAESASPWPPHSKNVLTWEVATREVVKVNLNNDKETFKKGRLIMEEVEQRERLIAEHVFLTMIIRDSSGKDRKRTLELWNEYDPKGQRKNLIRFTSPQLVRNTGLLSIEQEAGGEDDQWLYLPILRKSKRIAAAAKTNEFVGTDYTFEDLGSENLNHFQYEYQGEQTIDGQACFIIKATPLKGRLVSTGYRERIIFIRKDIYCPVEIHFYTQEGQLFKKLLASDLVNITGNKWRANQEKMIKVLENKSTLLIVDKRITSHHLDDATFSQRELTKEY